MRLIRKQIHCSCLHRLVLYFVCCHSLFYVQFELSPNGCRESCSGVNWSVSARAWVDWWCSLQTVCCWQRQVTARWANQLILTSSALRSTAQTSESGQRVQRASLIFLFFTKPSSRWQKIYNFKNRAYWTNLAVNGVIFQPLLHCLVRLYITMTKLSQKSCLVSLECNRPAWQVLLAASVTEHELEWTGQPLKQYRFKQELTKGNKEGNSCEK